MALLEITLEDTLDVKLAPIKKSISDRLMTVEDGSKALVKDIQEINDTLIINQDVCEDMHSKVHTNVAELVLVKAAGGTGIGRAELESHRATGISIGAGDRHRARSVEVDGR